MLDEAQQRNHLLYQEIWPSFFQDENQKEDNQG